jgi:hypothetical protein
MVVCTLHNGVDTYGVEGEPCIYTAQRFLSSAAVGKGETHLLST